VKKEARKTAHDIINQISHAEVAAIVRQYFPRTRGKRLDALAKQIIADTHRLISPRKQRDR
jgi:16S rRNA C1402 N4-methylase RsmH